jgi:hypothetical protein
MHEALGSIPSTTKRNNNHIKEGKEAGKEPSKTERNHRIIVYAPNEDKEHSLTLKIRLKKNGNWDTDADSMNSMNQGPC